MTLKGRFALGGVFLLVSLFLVRTFFPGRTPPVLPSLLDLDRNIACTTWPRQVPKVGGPETETSALAHAEGQQRHQKPSGFKIVVLIFFGRREYTDILDCYLRRNLVSNDGFVDEVQFVSNARDKRDTAWLNKLVSSVDEYRTIEVPERCNTSIAWTGCLWDVAADRNTLYFKIDDDVVFIHDDAIPSMVETRLKYKDAFAVGANPVNIHITRLPHLKTNAIRPFLPEPDVETFRNANRSWRTSADPLYSEAEAKELNLTTVETIKNMRPPFQGHRWLRLNDTDHALLKTPIAAVFEEADEHIINDNWAIVAQQQYSLLENLEKDQLERYHHPDNEDGVWDTKGVRYNINFIAVWGTDVADNLPFDREQTFAIDERLLTIDLPRETKRPFLVDSHALSVHFSFRTQRGITATDLLDRWRAYANEMVCDRPRKPFGPRCKGAKGMLGIA